MAVQVISDLHLEAPKAYDVLEIVPRAPYLALLGDIGSVVPDKDDLLAFLVRQLRQFRVIFFVPGNHEAYRGTWHRTLQILRAFEEDTAKNASLGEFVLLDRRAFQLPGTDTIILGCSLFSFISPHSRDHVSFGINDFYQTMDWNIDTHNEAHQRDLAWLNAQVVELEQSDSNVFIFTHWSPTTDTRAIDPKHATSLITNAFSTDLSQEACFKSGRVKIWAFGHTHYNCDVTVERDGSAGPLRLLANQHGYYFAQAEGFDAEKVIVVP